MDFHARSPRLANATTPTRACQCCAIAKSKCVPQPGTTNGTCARCARLKKNCIPAPSVIRKKKICRQTRTAKLEEKLESLVSLLSTTQQAGLRSEDVHVVRTQEVVPAPVSASIELETLLNSSTTEKLNDVPSISCFPQQGPSTGTETAAFQYFSSTKSPASTLDFSPALEPSSLDATANLDLFRNKYIRSFPFVVIPPEMSPQELKRKRPHLYRSIMVVASYHQPLEQMHRGKEFLQTLTTSVVINGEKSFDLLQALLVYACWHFHNFSVNPRLTSILHLAIGLMFDLRLNTAHFSEGEEIFCYSKAVTDDPHAEFASVADEQRAYLGCWFLSSTVSQSFRRLDSLRYSPYIDHCCDALSAAAEYHTDAFAVASVRLQCIIERIQDYFASRPSHQRIQLTAPIGMHIKLFQEELQSLKDSLPTNIQDDILFQTQYHNATGHLYEVAIAQSSPIAYGNSCSRFDILYAALLACQSFFTAHLSIPVASYPHVSFPDFARLSHALIMVFKLSLLKAPGWDTVQVRRDIDFLAYIDALDEKFQQAIKKIDAKGELKHTDAFSRCVWKLRRTRAWYEQKLKAEADKEREREKESGLGDRAMVGGVQEVNFDGDPYDENYWEQFLMDWGNVNENIGFG